MECDKTGPSRIYRTKDIQEAPIYTDQETVRETENHPTGVPHIFNVGLTASEICDIIRFIVNKEGYIGNHEHAQPQTRSYRHNQRHTYTQTGLRLYTRKILYSIIKMFDKKKVLETSLFVQTDKDGSTDKWWINSRIL